MKDTDTSSLLLLWRLELSRIFDEHEDKKFIGSIDKLRLKRIAKEINELLEELN